MKIELLTEIILVAPIETVWETLTHFASYPEWNSFMPRVTGKLLVGEKLTVEIVPPGRKKNTFTPVVTQVIPNQEMRWVGIILFDGLFRGEHYFRLEKIDPTTTKLIHGENFSGALVCLLAKVLKGATYQGFQKMNTELAKRIAKKL